MKRRQPSSRVKLDHHKVWELLNRLNMTQNELARLVGTSSGYLSQLMSGTRCPSADIRKRLMEALGITRFEDLFILEAGLCVATAPPLPLPCSFRPASP